MEAKMAEERYRIVFSGEIVDEAKLPSVKYNVRNLLKTDEAIIDRMFSGIATTIKNDIDHETALRFKADFDKTGASCRIEKLEGKSANSRRMKTVGPSTSGQACRRLDINLPREFAAVMDLDEEIFWSGSPDFTAFIIRGIPLLIFGLLWGAMDYFGFIRHMRGDQIGFAIPFFAIHLFPLWLGILGLIHLFLVHGNTCYAITNKRLMMRSGFWGTDFKSLDYDQIVEIDVTVNPVENSLGVGTIQAFSGNTSSKGTRIYDYLVGIKNPYEVFKMIKEISVDIKTDWNYPNALRPEINPGYQTSYSRK